MPKIFSISDSALNLDDLGEEIESELMGETEKGGGGGGKHGIKTTKAIAARNIGNAIEREEKMLRNHF